MIYIVHGEQAIMIKQFVLQIVKDNLEEINEFNFINYDAYKTPLHEIVNDAETIPFMSNKKVVVVNNAYFLGNERPKLDFEQSFDELERYLDNQVKDTVLIFTYQSKGLKDSKIMKKIKSKASIKSVTSLNEKDLHTLVKNMFKERKTNISYEALSELIRRVGNDLIGLSNEVEKLSAYKNDLNLEDINLLVSKKLDDNVFEMIDYLFQRKLDKVFEIYSDLKLMGSEPITLIALVASQVRFLYQLGVLSNKGYSEAKIASELKVHPYRVKLGLKKLKDTNKKRLEAMLLGLSDLDYNIKTGVVDRFIGFELFLVESAKKSIV